MLELRAIKDIQEGDEVTVNYISVEGRYSDREARQQRLSDGWGFHCDCRLCVSGNDTSVLYHKCRHVFSQVKRRM